jgi:hypothetical protein
MLGARRNTAIVFAVLLLAFTGTMSAFIPQIASALPSSSDDCPDGGDTLPKGDVGPCDVTLINIQLTPGGGLDISGDTIPETTTNNLVTNSGSVVSVLPSYLDVTITDTKTGKSQPTYVGDPANPGYYGDSKNQSGEPAAGSTSDGYILYQVFGDATGSGSGPFKICASGVNVPKACITDPLNNGNDHSSASLPLVTSQAIAGSISLPLPSSYVPPKTAAAGSVANNTPAPAASNTNAASCESNGSTLGWLFCGLYNDVNDASGWILYNIIEPELRTTPLCVDSQSSGCANDATYQVWSTFRVYGDIFLVIVLLIIVFGEAIGGGLIEAYTVKKVLPRLLAAAILINLSFYLVAIMVDLTNVIGGGLGQLITAPLHMNSNGSSGGFLINASGITTNNLEGVGIVGTVAALGSTSVFALFSTEGAALIVLGAVLPALLAVLAVLFTVLIRKAIITALIFISPVAFALWCLPNTEKYFKRWWDLLFEMLMVYPIIVLMFAVGDILSVTSANITGQTATLKIFNFITSFLFLIIPLLLIPTAFKLAGSSIGRIHEAIQGGRARAHNMSKGRRERARQRYGMKRAGVQSAAYSRAAKTPGLGTVLNKTPGVGYAFGRRMQTLDQKNRMLGAELAKDPRAAAIQHDDNALRAATYGGYNDAVKGLLENDPTMKREEAQRAARAAQTSIGFGRAQAIWSAQSMAQTGTAYKDIEDVAATIARASGGNATTSDSLAGNINSATKAANRHDLAPGYSDLSALARGVGGLDGGSSDYDTARVKAWKSASLYQHANDRPDNIKAAIKHYSSASTLATPQGREEAAVFYKELQAMRPNAVGAVADAIDTAMSARGGGNDILGLKVGGNPIPKYRADPLDTSKRIPDGFRDATLGDLDSVKSKVREYRRPDPNDIP